MKTFHIGFSKNREGKIFSRLLQWYMKKDYSHVFFEFEENILHAEINDGVNYWSKDKFDEHNIKTRMYEVKVSNKYYEKMRSELDEHVGHKYALMQNLGVLIVDAMKALGVSVRNPFRKGDNCSELAFHGLSETYPEILDLYKSNSIRPDHIEEILKNKHFKHVKLVT